MAGLNYSVRLSALFTAALLAASSAQAQISTINSTYVKTREWNDIPGATLTSLNLYPSQIIFGESGVSAATGFANRDVWRFSGDGGTSPYQFKNSDYFSLSVALTLTGNPITPRKEAGILFSTASKGDIQFIVNTDGHEVVQFGGISFYKFNDVGLSYNSGDRITLGMDYFLDQNGRNALQFTANGLKSPVSEFDPGAGIGDGSTLGGYFQIVNDAANPNNAGSAIFENIAVPEPSVMALVGLGCLSLLLRRRS